MRALVYHGPEDLRLSDVPEPKPAPGEVLVRVKACGICGSDVHGYLGITGRRLPPMIMGHEFAGEVAALGAGVAGVAVGARVAVYPIAFCGVCAQCRRGSVHHCLNKKALGVLDCNGAMAEYVCVPERSLFEIGDNVPFEIGSMMEPLAVACRAVNLAGDLAGKTVVVVGAGTIGLFITVLAKAKGPARLIVSDLSDSRLAVARRMGADRVVDPSKEKLAEVARAESDGAGADVALEAVGATPTVQQAMGCLRLGGTAVWVGNSAKMIEVDMQEVVTRELTVLGSFLYSLEEFRIVAELLNARTIDVSPIISALAPMERGVEYFRRLAKDPGPLLKVVLNA
ncbi:MAG: alcohol dehydrogenase catalytic domain-containing protein [Rhodoplanes sp.]|uniref:zinc-dependent alcohol dehydrogenase n=1 Tax=Rhodoplanes sp. TaxID=1968906 RepID=UPI0017DED240|nr:alcohol dehydrogenase catalytic domain-containing protein [Rhodoplanes sp.]NVO16290.1 alcohol dehydrogenase catalytic domain-containing protein [Rhodoplanes sp.]